MKQTYNTLAGLVLAATLYSSARAEQPMRMVYDASPAESVEQKVENTKAEAEMEMGSVSSCRYDSGSKLSGLASTLAAKYPASASTDIQNYTVPITVGRQSIDAKVMSSDMDTTYQVD